VLRVIIRYYVENILSNSYNVSMSSGYPGANCREARKLGLLRSKSTEAERERMEPQERNERVCVGCPDAMLILMEYGPG